MPYPNNKIDLRKIIRESNQKNRENWKKIMDDNKKRNKRKKEMINDPKTPKAQRSALIFEDIMTTLPEVKKQNRRKK